MTTPNAGAIVTLLEPILAAQSLEQAASAAAAQIGAASRSVAAGCFLVIHGRTFISSWYPDDRIANTPLGAQLERVARAAPSNVAPELVRLPDGAEQAPRVLVLPLKARVTAVLCLAGPAHDLVDDLLDGIASLVAGRLRTIQELEAERRRSGQYERWFRVADRQIRALDLERQKFAALAQAIPIGVFVMDRDGVIRWISDPMHSSFPTRPDNRSWLGAPYDQFCQQFGSEHDAPSHSCILAQAVMSKRPASVVLERPAGKRYHLAATPITNLEGQVQEVMVAIRLVPCVEASAALPTEEDDRQVSDHAA